MKPPRFRRPRGPLVHQGLIAILVIATAALLPPAHGAILLLPLGRGSDDGDAVARWSIAAGAQLLGPGPLPGSLVVVGDRGALAAAAWRHRSLIVTGAFAGCGAGPVA
jgi:hypothetical protein